MIDTSKHWVGHVSALLAIVFFAVNIPLTKYILDGWVGASSYALIRCLMGAIVFWIISIFQPPIKVHKRGDYLRFFVSGVFGMALFLYLFASGMGMTSPIDASIILTISPIIVLILSAFVFKEKITISKSFGILLSLAGALMIILLQGKHGDSGGMLGNIFMFVSATLYGAYLVYTRPLSKSYDPIFLLKWIFLFATLATLPFGLGELLDSKLFTEPNSNAILITLFIGLFPGCVSYLLIPIALKSISSTMVSTYNYAIPFIASIMAILMHQAVLRWDEPISLALIIIGVYFVSYTKKSSTLRS